jgi:hypothetical protein
MIHKVTKDLNESIWKELYVLQKKLTMQSNQDTISSDYEVYKCEIINAYKDKTLHLHTLNDGNELVGLLTFKTYYYDKKIEFAKVYIQFLPKELHPSLISEIKATLVNHLNENNLDRFIAETSEEKVGTLLEHLRGRKINQLNYYQLDIGNVNHTVIEKWLGNVSVEKGDSYRITYSEFISEDIIEEFTQVFTTLMNDIIRDEKQERFQETPEGLRKKMEMFRSKGIKLFACLIYHRNKIIGISFSLIPETGGIASQEMTGILKGYRGKGLGKYYLRK